VRPSRRPPSDAGLPGEDGQVRQHRAGLGDDPLQAREQRSESWSERGGHEYRAGRRILRVVSDRPLVEPATSTDPAFRILLGTHGNRPATVGDLKARR